MLGITHWMRPPAMDLDLLLACEELCPQCFSSKDGKVFPISIPAYSALKLSHCPEKLTTIEVSMCDVPRASGAETKRLQGLPLTLQIYCRFCRCCRIKRYKCSSNEWRHRHVGGQCTDPFPSELAPKSSAVSRQKFHNCSKVTWLHENVTDS